MFGTIVEKLQALLSRSFLVGNYFPVLVFCAVNFLIMWYGVDGFSKFVTAIWPLDSGVASSAFAGVLIAVAILAFMINPLIPLFRLALEGQLLPAWVRSKMIERHAQRFAKLQSELNTAKSAFAAFRAERAQAETQLGDARNDPSAPRNSTDAAALNSAVSAVEALDVQITQRQGNTSSAARLPEMATVRTAVQQMTNALRFYSMKSGMGVFNQATFDRLNAMQFQLLTTLDAQRDLAYLALQEADARRRERFVEGDIKATLLANSRAAMEQYPQLAYKVDFQFIWTRLGMVLSKNAAIQTAVETAGAQLDFSVLTTALAAITTIVWIALLPWLGSSIVPFLAVALVGPPVVLFLYHLVDASQQAFGAVAVMAIDALRFELMSALHLPLPNSLDSEQKLWEGLQFALYSAFDADIRFRHPKS